MKRHGARRRAALAALLPLALLATACDRAPPRAGAAPDTAAPTDTVVRRVVRVVRVPTLMQRVTGAVVAFHALRPLDSAFAIRVMDQRGLGMPGVRVSWTIQAAGDGAALRVMNARTDSLGLSHASFTPGQTALPQTVIAEVEGVGRIPFTMKVPAASIHVVAEQATVWSDDRVVVRAELRDVAGTALAAEPLGWGSSDTTVAVVESADQGRATVRGRAAGTADVIAWVEPGRVRAGARVRVRPTIRGAIVTLDGSPVPDIRLELRSGASRESVTVTGGRFNARPEFASYYGVEVRAHPASTAYHGVHASIEAPRALQDLRVVLVPTAWRIDKGTYAGREIAIDAAAALRRTGRGGGFWRLPPVSRGGPAVIIGWPPSAFPLRIAFNRGRSRDPIAAGDSAAFWRIAEQMEADLGARLFTPAQVSGDSASPGIVTVEIGTDVAAGHTFVTWNDAGSAYDGTLMFRSSATLRDAHVVTHELLHLLGFGHASSFATVSVPAGGSEQRLTPQDVAHAQLALRLRELQARTGARPGLPAPAP